MASRSDDLDHYKSRCTRFLSGHGAFTPAEILAAIPADLGADRYGEGGAVAALEAEVRKVLGKPAAVFMPSGTMAQQIALRIHADRRNRRAVAWHPACHLEIAEDKAYQRLHGLVGVNVGSARSLMTAQALQAVKEPLAAVLIELPQREIGGVLPDWDDLKALVAYARKRGAAVHMDGARLWEATPYYKKTPAQVAAPFDSVYVSFYKGLGGLAGSCLAGDEDFIDEARAWRKRFGGTLYSLWPYAASGLAGLRRHLPQMAKYHEHAKAIAAKLSKIEGVEVMPDPPHTNMMHLLLHAEEKRFKAAVCRIAREQGIYTFRWSKAGQSRATRIVEFTVGASTLGFRPREVAGLVEALVR